jgi:hypothetical protein
MFNTLHRSIGALATILVLGTTAGPAAADEITVAFAGRAMIPADAGCFQEYFGTLRNICSTPKMLLIPMAVDEPGYHAVTVTAFAATASNYVQCDALGVYNTTTPSFATYHESGWKGLSTFGAAENIALASTFVPGGGAIYVACQLNPNGQVNIVHITP